jgi:hypothetical protein
MWKPLYLKEADEIKDGKRSRVSPSCDQGSASPDVWNNKVSVEKRLERRTTGHFPLTALFETVQLTFPVAVSPASSRTVARATSTITLMFSCPRALALAIRPGFGTNA